VVASSPFEGNLTALRAYNGLQGTANAIESEITIGYGYITRVKTHGFGHAQDRPEGEVLALSPVMGRERERGGHAQDGSEGEVLALSPLMGRERERGVV